MLESINMRFGSKTHEKTVISVGRYSGDGSFIVSDLATNLFVFGGVTLEDVFHVQGTQ